MIACPNCGKENQDHYKFCLGCGSDLPRTDQKEVRKTATPPTGIPAVAGEETVSSPGPGFEIPVTFPEPDDSSPTEFVEDTQPPPDPSPFESPEPEKEVAAPPEEAEKPADGKGLVCGSCGTAIPRGFAFCGACGTPVPGAQTAAAPETDVAPTPGGARLVLIQPDGTEGGHVEIPTSEVAVGRDAGGFFGNDPFLSPTHAIFCSESNGVKVKDADSLNGTYVKISPNDPVEIKSGAIFRMGQEIILFEEIDKGSDAPDGTAKIGSPIEGLWARVALIVGEGRLGNAFTISGEGIVLGRERGDIIFPEDGYVSGIHLRVYTENGKYYLNDLGSSNGTFLKLTKEQTLTAGSFLLMGQQLFRIDL